MKIMKNLFLVLTLMLSTLSFNALADCDNEVKYISDEGVKSAALVACLKAEKVNDTTANVVKDTLSNPDKLSALASSYSSAVGIMARDLGMAANEFIKTDAGELAVLALIWTLFGSTIQGIFGSFIMVPVVFLMWRKAIDAINPIRIEEISRDGKTIKVKSRLQWRELTDSQCTCIFFASCASMLSIILIGCVGLMP